MSANNMPSLLENGVLTVAVLSDLHAYDTCEDKNPSFYCIRDPFEQTPLGELIKLIDREQLKADILLCGGDLADKADPAAIREVWARINQAGQRLGAHLVAGTVGNHDIDSRFTHSDHDPKGHLQTLTPPFPLPYADANDRFWSRNYEIVTGHEYRLVVLNSSAFHGGGKDEYQHGRISALTLHSLRERLSSVAPPRVNILLCHHHPQKHMEFDLGEYDEMRSGQLLLEQLGSGDCGDWIVIHGHKHHPKLCYAPGGSSAPVIFSAGSLCHVLFPELSSVAQRQFYILRFPFAQYDTIGFAGTFRAWDWAFKNGWGKPTHRSGLPATGGFGYRTSLNLFANEITNWVGSGLVAWRDFIQAFPTFEFLLPKDVDGILKQLQARGIGVQFENDVPTFIGAHP